MVRGAQVSNLLQTPHCPEFPTSVSSDRHGMTVHAGTRPSAHCDGSSAAPGVMDKLRIEFYSELSQAAFNTLKE